MTKRNVTYSHKWLAPAILALAIASAPAAARAATNLTISEFLKSISGSTDTKDLPPSNVARQYIEASAIEESQYKIIIDDNYAPYDTNFKITDAYEAFCKSKGGELHPIPSNNNQYLYTYYTNELQRYDQPNISGYQLFTQVCQHRTSQSWSAMAIVVADRIILERRFDWSNVAPLNIKTFSTTTTVIAVDPAVFDSQVQQKMRSLLPRKHKTAPSRVLNPFRDEQSSYLLLQREFQAGLALGDQTNCGKILEIRGPWIKVALPKGILFHKEPSAWINKDRLTNDPPVDCTNG
jgi:hypothetical protein